MRDLDLLLGTQLKVRLLRALAQLHTPVSARQATRLAGVSVKGTRALDELSKLGILDKREATAQHLYRLQEEHYFAAPLKALFAAEESKLRDVADLLSGELSDSPEVALGAIFGSAARGDGRSGSDFDVLVLVTEKAAADAVLDGCSMLRRTSRSDTVQTWPRSFSRSRSGVGAPPMTPLCPCCGRSNPVPWRRRRSGVAWSGEAAGEPSTLLHL